MDSVSDEGSGGESLSSEGEEDTFEEVSGVFDQDGEYIHESENDAIETERPMVKVKKRKTKKIYEFPYDQDENDDSPFDLKEHTTNKVSRANLMMANRRIGNTCTAGTMS